MSRHLPKLIRTNILIKERVVLILNVVTKIQSLLFRIAFYIEYDYICKALAQREEGTLKVPSFYLYTIIRERTKLYKIIPPNYLKAMRNKIEALIEEKFKEEGFEDCFLVDINRPEGSNKLEIFVDADSGINYKTCQRLSRYLEEYIDESQWLGEKYTLEVSSPGIGRPLKFNRQYKKNIGRKVAVKLNAGGTEEGVLTDVTESEITIERKERVKQGKKKANVVFVIPIPFEDIKETKVKISF